MFVARVTGSVVSTQKVDSMVGQKLLVVEPYRLEATDRKSRRLQVVPLLLSIHFEPEWTILSYLTQGSSARMTECTSKLPVDAVVIGIVDQVHVDDGCVYHREHGA